MKIPHFLSRRHMFLALMFVVGVGVAVGIVLSRSESTKQSARKRLSEKFIDQTGVPLYKAIEGLPRYGPGDPAGEDLNKQIVASVASVLSEPITFSLDRDELDEFLHEVSGLGTVIYGIHPDAVLAYVPQYHCTTASSRSIVIKGSYYVFSRSGESWFLEIGQPVDVSEAYNLSDGWLIFANRTYSDSANIVELWQIVSVDGSWTFIELSRFNSRCCHLQAFEFIEERLILHNKGMMFNLPCPGNTFVFFGENMEVYERDQRGIFVQVENKIDMAEIMTGGIGARLETWQWFCSPEFISPNPDNWEQDPNKWNLVGSELIGFHLSRIQGIEFDVDRLILRTEGRILELPCKEDTILVGARRKQVFARGESDNYTLIEDTIDANHFKEEVTAALEYWMEACIE